MEFDYTSSVSPRQHSVSDETIDVILLGIVLWEKSLQFADWWWTSVVGAGISLLVCPLLLIEFYHHATMAGPHHLFFSWLALAMVIATAVCFLALIKAAKTASARRASD